MIFMTGRYQRHIIKSISNQSLSNNIAVIQWITSCHKNRTATLWREHVTSLTSSISTMRFEIDTIFIFKVKKSHFEEQMMNKILHL